jgi:hypothetical protein
MRTPAPEFKHCWVNVTRREGAFGWLDKGYHARAGALVYIGSDPSLESLYNDLRFDDLLRRIGLPS